jgi:hypothetical protein
VPASDTFGARCFVGSSTACTDAGGTYGGDNSTCRTAGCPAACACDWDHSGALTPGDFHAFFHDFIMGNADFDGDGDTDRDDLTAFIACAQSPAGCGGGGILAPKAPKARIGRTAATTNDAAVMN